MEREKTTFLKINNRWHSFKMFCIKRAQFISLNYWKNCNTYFVFKIKETSTKIFSPYQLRNFLSKEQDYHDTFFREKSLSKLSFSWTNIFLGSYFTIIWRHRATFVHVVLVLKCIKRWRILFSPQYSSVCHNDRAINKIRFKECCAKSRFVTTFHAQDARRRE